MKTRRQRIIIDPEGIARFKGNEVVDFLLDQAKRGRRCDLNDLFARFNQSDSHLVADLRQLYRLIGYSVSGYGDVFPEDPNLAAYDAKVAALLAKRQAPQSRSKR